SERMVQQTTMFIEGVFPEYRPDVTILWYNDPDLTFHHKGLGSPEAVSALQALDREFARILDWRDSGAGGGNVQILVVSDHGHLTARERVTVAPDLKAAGFTIGQNGDALVGAIGYMGAIRSMNGDQGQLERLAAGLAEQPWCGLMFSANRNGVDGVIPGTLSRSLLSNDHKRSADLFYIMRSDDGLNAAGVDGTCFFQGDMPDGGSIHSGLHRREMNNLMAFGGSAFRQGHVSRVPTGVIDVAPTVLHLLGLDAPAAMEGRIVTEALQGSTADPDHSSETFTVEGRAGIMTLRRNTTAGVGYIHSGAIS
ncbi:MAG: alkaline phosphatase family protein, partial [Rhodospirillales bacterium]